MDPLAPRDSPALRKARGAFFTPAPLARYITDWAVRDVADEVLEPSCGEAAFLHAAVDRLTALRDASGSDSPRLDGVELHEDSAEAARTTLSKAGVEADIRVADFFTIEPTGSYDAVIGNPPYVRYQAFSGAPRTRSQEAALRAGVSLTNLASSWAAFTVHAALFLNRGGRLGLVLPAELLTVNYAAQVRRFLMDRFASVDLVLFDERVFPEVQEEVVLLMAEGYGQGPTDHCRIIQVRNAGDLSAAAVPRLWKPDSPEAKWTPSLLSTETLSAYASLVGSEGFTTLDAWGRTTLGMVTGNNGYFALSPQRARELGLAPGDLLPLSPPGSRHLRGLSFTPRALAALGQAGARTHLFRPVGEPSGPARAYIEAGEHAGIDRAYKCRVRAPWWRVPLVAPADLLLTYMNADTPRLCTNRAGVHHLNSVHGVSLRAPLRRLGRDTLPLAALNSMTLLGAETVGRAYGGGMLKIEPREAARLPVPSGDLVEAARKPLAALRPVMTDHLRRGDLAAAVHLVDDVLLVGELGLGRDELGALREGHRELTARRQARGSRPGG